MESRNITVTELVRACLDEHCKRALKSGRKHVDKPLISAGQYPVGGQYFHLLVAKFLSWLVSEPASATLREGAALWRECYKRFASDKLEELCKSDRIDTALNLSNALEAFCQRIAALRHAAEFEADWNDVFLAQEYPLQDVPFRFGQNVIFLSGVMDAIRINPSKGIEVADYKLSRGANVQEDLLQIAIYARMLRERNPGIVFHAVLEYYSPAFEALEILPEELGNLFSQLVEPVLRELAILTPPPNVHEAEAKNYGGSEEFSEPDLSEAIAACFRSFKLDVTPSGLVKGPQIFRYILRPSFGVKVVSLANRAKDLQVALSLPDVPRIEPSSNGVTIDIPRRKPETVHWGDVIARCPADKLRFPIGVAVDGSVVSADLSDPSSCHALVGGTSGSGKSEWLKSLVASLIARSDACEVKIALVDPKLITFKPIEHSSHLLRPLLTEVRETLDFLKEALNEMERRYSILASRHASNLAELRAARQDDIPFWVIIFDEFADLILSGADEKKEFERMVSRIAGKGRAAGIHLVLATQRPDSKVVTGLIKANLPLKICLRVISGANSQIVLDEPGAERLLGRGDLLYDVGRGIHRAQGAFISTHELVSLAVGRTDKPKTPKH